MKKPEMAKTPEAVDVLFTLGCLLISAGMGVWLGLAGGLISMGVFCLIASFLTEPSGKGGDS